MWILPFTASKLNHSWPILRNNQLWTTGGEFRQPWLGGSDMLCSLNMMGKQENTSLLHHDLRHFSLTYTRPLFHQQRWSLGLNLILLKLSKQYNSKVQVLFRAVSSVLSSPTPKTRTRVRKSRQCDSIAYTTAHVCRLDPAQACIQGRSAKQTHMHILTQTHTNREEKSWWGKGARSGFLAV